MDLAQQQLPALPAAVARAAALPLLVLAACGGDRTAGRVVLSVDAPCWIEVDGRPAGEISPGRPHALLARRGTRRLELVTRGGELRRALAVEVKATPVVRVVALAADAARVRQDYARIPAGGFEMGCVDGDEQCAADEGRRRLTIPRDFWMMRTEVTVAAYAALAAPAGRPMPPSPSFNAGWRWGTHPVVNVTREDAAGHCARAGGRLPTEVEWEYAARGGRAGQRYVWGDAPRPVAAGYKQANVGDERAKGTVECQDGPCLERYDDGYSRTSPAFQYSPNGFGLFDMAGNVWEWSDDAAGVLRGGSWSSGLGGLRVSKRQPRPAADAGESIGFRCVRDVAVPSEEPARVAPVERTAAPPGRLRVVTDEPASLVIDGEPAGQLSPGQPLSASLEQGEHLLAAAGAGGEARWERVVAVGAAPADVAVALRDTASAVRRDYVRVPAGRFEMGCVPGDAECEGNEGPRHAVAIGLGFWMMKTEATVAAYKAYAARTGAAMPPAPDTNPGWLTDTHPVVNLTWDDAAAYCRDAGGRLPTEAEWEYAARGGRRGERYAWGNGVRPIVNGRAQANVGDERAKRRVGCPQCGWFDGYDDGHVYTAPVASFAANGFGLFDMAGNAIEWCADWYRERYYDTSPGVDPPGSEFGRWRVLRGGSWSMGPKGLRTSARGGFPPDRTTDNYGVRCVRDVARP